MELLKTKILAVIAGRNQTLDEEKKGCDDEKFKIGGKRGQEKFETLARNANIRCGQVGYYVRIIPIQGDSTAVVHVQLFLLDKTYH